MRLRGVMIAIPARASHHLRGRIGVLFGLLITANVAAWLWALVAFRDDPALLATALVAYGFGLRHAVDADHIAAIDNVVRKQMSDGRRPLSVGLFFSLGHSTVVILVSVAVALTASAMHGWFEQLKVIGALMGTVISGMFLLVIAGMNGPILLDLWAQLRSVRAGGPTPAHADIASAAGLLSRVFAPAMRLVSRSWHMYPLGFLFGLGFDTATEIGLLGMAAASATNGLPIRSILIFPALFTTAMSLVDTADGVLMLGAYGWALVEPRRRIYYNLAITMVSVAVAVAVGGVEVVGLLGDRLSLQGRFWRVVGWLNDNINLAARRVRRTAAPAPHASCRSARAR